MKAYNFPKPADGGRGKVEECMGRECGFRGSMVVAGGCWLWFGVWVLSFEQVVVGLVAVEWC
jgi:hypothetical protein